MRRFEKHAGEGEGAINELLGRRRRVCGGIRLAMACGGRGVYVVQRAVSATQREVGWEDASRVKRTWRREHSSEPSRRDDGRALLVIGRHKQDSL